MGLLDRFAAWAFHPDRCLATAALLLAAGLAAGLLAPLDPGTPAVFAAVILAVWCLALSLRMRRAAFLLAAVLLPLGGCALLARTLHPVSHGGELTPFAGRVCRIAGTVSGVPVPFDGGLSVRIECSRVQDGPMTYRIRDPMRVSVYDAAPGEIGPGDEVRAELLLRIPTGKRFPGGSSQRLALAGEGVGLVGAVEAGPRFLVRREPAPLLWRPILFFSRRASELFSTLGQPADGLLHALILGRRHRLGPELQESFRLSGLAHLLSVSGIHVSLAGLFVYAVALFLLRRWNRLTCRFDARRAAAVLAAPPVIFYTLVTGSEAPAVRSCLMALLVFGGLVLERSAWQVASLALAALAILVWSPTDLFSPSFQLSFLAVAAILAAVARFPRLFREKVDGFQGLLYPWIPRYLTISAAAFLGTFPLTAYHFSLIAPAGLAANLVAIPLCGWTILPFGLTAGVLSLVSPTLARLAVVPAIWGCDLTASLAGWIAGHGGLAIRDFRPTPAQVAGLYLIIVSLPLLGRRAGRAILALGVICLIVAVAVAGGMRHRQGLTVTFLDVGEGDAALVQLSDGRNILVDGGGKFGSYDRGAQVVLPAIRAMGVRRLDALVLTHPHPDHAGGAAVLLREMEVGEIYVPWTDGPERLAALWGGLPRDGLRFRPVGDGHRVRIGEAELIFMNPPLADRLPVGSDWYGDAQVNNRSLVCLIRDGGRALLFAGDAGREVLDDLASRHGPDLRAEVLKVAHHGSRFARSETFYGAAKPGVAVVTAGRNAFGHPAPGVLASLEERGARVMVTGRDGSVELGFPPGGEMTMRVWSGKNDRLSPAGLGHWFFAGY